MVGLRLRHVGSKWVLIVSYGAQGYYIVNIGELDLAQPAFNRALVQERLSEVVAEHVRRMREVRESTE